VAASYQLNSGLSANVAGLTSNSTNFVGTVSAANVVSNAQLISNLASYQTTAGLSGNVAGLTSNSTNFVGTVSAANVVSNAQLISNLSSYQLNSTLAANVATMAANNSTNFAGQGQAYYANASSYPGAFNGTIINASANITSNATISANQGIISTGYDSGGSNLRLINGSYGFIQRNDGTNYYHMITASANQTGTWNSLRPYTIVLSTGALTIDQTGAGVSFGGNISLPNTSAIISIGNSTVNSSINSTTYSGTANNSAYLGGVAAASYQLNSGLSANVATLTSNNSAYLGGTAASAYQLNSTLAANVAGLNSNNSTYLGGHAQSYFANTTSYTGAFNGTTINASGNAYVNSFIQSISILTTTISANYSVSNTDLGTVILVNSSANVYLTFPNTLPTNGKLLITRIGSGNVNISNNAGLTLGSRTNNYNILNQYGSVSIFTVNNSLLIVDGNI
jgi:hypothetical protein